MRLTSYTDFSLRVLIYLAAHPGRVVSTEEISSAYGISNNHLVKVVNNLGHHGFVKVKRGRHGGIMLERAPTEINLGEVVRACEPDFYLADCFNPNGSCPISQACRLKGLLNEAKGAFMAVLNRHHLAELVPDDVVAQSLRSLFLTTGPGPGDEFEEGAG